MKLLPIAVLLAAAAHAQQPVNISTRVDWIEFYGVHRVSQNLVRQALGISEGSALPPSRIGAEERLLDIEQVVSAQLEVVCCEGGKTILYVGIEEFGAPHYEIRPAPGGSALLDDANPTLAILREALRESSDPQHRARAAQLLANKAGVVEDLHAALTDNDSLVRAIAAKALMTQKGASSEWFVPMLLSLDRSDRVAAVTALESFTRTDKAILRQLRGPTLDSLIDVSRWRTEQYAYPAFQLIGRVAGLADVTTRDSWLRAGRDSVIAKAKAVK